MKISRHSPVALAIAVALSAQGAATMAHAAVDGALEEIVVTATKREQKLKEVPMGISAVAGDDLVRRNETGFVDFAAQVPGLSLQPVNPGQIRLVLRGANVGSVGATVATVIDDIPFSATGAQTNGVFFGANIDTYDMQRIEVLRGPQGTLYGATAEGGLIRYVTNAPDLDNFAADIGAGGESVSGGGSAARLRGMVNIPLVDGKLAFRASAVQEDRPGWIDNTELGRDDWNDIEKYSFRASLLWQPTDNLSARLSVFRQNLVSHGRNTIRVVGSALNAQSPPDNKFDAVDGMSTQTGVATQVENDLTVYAATLDYEFDSFSLMSSTSYGELDLPYVNDATYINVVPGLTYGDFFGAFIYGVPTQILINQTDFLHKFNQELRIASKPGSTLGSHGFDWQAGVFFTHEVTMLNQPVSAISAVTGEELSPPVGGAVIPSGLKELSGFADFTYYLTDQFDVSFGARHSKTEQYSQVRTKCCILFGPGEDFETLRSDENKTTYSLAPRFRFDDDTMVYARFATGYRAGGPNLPTPTLPNPPLLKPDSTENYEVGFRTELLDGKLSVDLSVFQIDWKDVQVLSIVQTETGPVGINGNAGEARSRGIEWNLQLRVLDNLTLGFLGAYTDAKLTSDAAGLGAAKGDELPYVPDLQTTLNVDWALGSFGGYTATAGASYTHVASQYTDFSPSASVESHVKLPDYQTLKVQVGIDNGKFSLQLYANNLTDEDAYVGYANSGGAGQTGLATVIQPRTVGVFAGYRF